jgi:hypothetical protein
LIHRNFSPNVNRPCRIVIDDLDGVSQNDSDRLLDEARRLIYIWPNLAILATSRPGSHAEETEILLLESWPTERGADLLRLVLDGDEPYGMWNPETLSLLTSPLLALAAARRIRAGRGYPASRRALLSGVVSDIIESKRSQRAGPAVWSSLASLAARILDAGGSLASASFGNEAEIWQITATDLVVNEQSVLRFALPLFEQHFAAQALRTDNAKVDEAAGSLRFPLWRYALAFAVASSDSQAADAMLARLARANPAAASWVIDEVDEEAERRDLEKSAGGNRSVVVGEDGVAIDGQVTFVSNLGSRSLTAGNWLREASIAFLEGFGSLAPRLARYNNGRLARWGFGFSGEYAVLAVSRSESPPPPVVEISTQFSDLSLAQGWSFIEGVNFPKQGLDRWRWARRMLQKSLAEVIGRRTLSTARDSTLDQERQWFLVEEIVRKHPNSRMNPADREAVLAKVDEMMETVNTTVRAYWSGGSYRLDSDDIRWIHAKLLATATECLRSPWPSADLNQSSARWDWQTFSPELIGSFSEDVIRASILGYQELIDMNFPLLDRALRLYNSFPLRFDGLVSIPNEG